jgi:hypothetical protein
MQQGTDLLGDHFKGLLPNLVPITWPDIWDLVRHLAAKGRKYSEKNAISVWQIFSLKTGKSQDDIEALQLGQPWAP